jgi:hypothetical protein
MALTLKLQEFPPMMQLQVHLEGRQYVVFDGNNARALREHNDSHLTAFFKANARYPEARNLLYADFPTKFTWDYKHKQWCLRKRGKTSGRMVFIPPNAGETFYARLILSVATNLRSFDDMKTVCGVLYPSYHEACLARGLLADNRELKNTLEEGKYMQTGRWFRMLFVMIVRDCQP